MKILVTGGAGYIGSHTILQLLQDGNSVLAFDNFSNSEPESLRRVTQLANLPCDVVQGDIQDGSAIDDVMADLRPDAVIHFAGLKAVGESTDKPLEYYAQNVFGTIALLKSMERHGCKRIVFSSSATVYGEAQYLPYDEAHPIAPTSPYGRTKAFVEDIIRDWVASQPGTSAALLRYFNPVGAHASGRIGEDPSGIPNNLVPYIARVAVGTLKELGVFGDTYDTRDGTGERDYIHVEDLASAHLAALNYIEKNTGCEAINIGTGTGATVLEMIAAFETASGRPVPYKVMAKRDGDVGRMLSSVDKAERLLGWKARLGIREMCETTWHWQSSNSDGYNTIASE